LGCLLLENVDNEVLVLADKVICQSLGLEVFAEVLPPVGVESIELLES
jgi:hypothetical protein